MTTLLDRTAQIQVLYSVYYTTVLRRYLSFMKVQLVLIIIDQ
jgi:hypothetical protein